MKHLILLLSVVVITVIVPFNPLLWGDEKEAAQPKWFDDIQKLVLQSIEKADAETYNFRETIVKEWESQLPANIAEKDKIFPQLIRVVIKTKCLNSRVKYCLVAVKGYFQTKEGKLSPEDQSRLSLTISWLLYSTSKEEASLVEGYDSIRLDLEKIIGDYEAQLKQTEYYAQKNPIFGVFVDKTIEIITQLRKINGRIKNAVELHKKCQDKFSDQIETFRRLSLLIHKTKFDVLDKLLVLAEEAENTAKALVEMSNLKE